MSDRVILPARPPLMRGSLLVLRRKCGKPNCRCAQGEQHETHVLSYSTTGKTRMVTVGEEDVEEVRAALGRYEAAAKRLEQEAMEGIAWLRERGRGRKRGHRL